MAFSLNRIMLIGNLGHGAQHRTTTNNLSVTTFSLATKRSYKGKDGNWVNETTWHNIVAYNLPDTYKEKLTKGAKFYVEGRLNKREYVDKEGVKKQITEVVSENMIPLEKHETGGEENAEQQQTGNEKIPDGSIDDDLPF